MTQSYCTLWCNRMDTHTPPAVPASIAPALRDLAKLSDIPYPVLLARMAVVVRDRIRAAPDPRRWLDTNGTEKRRRFAPNGPVVKVDPLTDKTLNPRRIPRAAPFYIAWTLLSLEVIEKCKNGTLQEVLRSLEPSSSWPPP